MNTHRMCDDHPGQIWINCSPCRADALVSGSTDAIIAWNARRQHAELDTRIPTRYVTANATDPGVRAWLERWHAAANDCPSLILVGPVGTGKTWQAYGAIREAVTGPNTTDWLAISAVDLYASMRPRDGLDTENVMQRYRDVGLLMIDDLGVGKHSEWVEEVVYRVIDARYEAMRPIVFTSNVEPERFGELFGERVASRLAEIGMVVAIVGADRRKAALT